MAELRFDNRVAVITGAGRGIGRAYAILLASRGAKIVVNDPGVTSRGEGIDAGVAEEVVRTIRTAGGDAVACTESIATPEGGSAAVKTAIDHYGRIDILIHNAGIVRRAPLEEMTYEDLEAVLDVHLRGAFHVVRPAFAHMRKAHYGRIVLTASCSGLYGNARSANYAMAKMGVIGLSNVVALEGSDHDVKCNVIVPAAVTRMADGLDVSAYPPMGPELVAPAVGWLAHDTCSVTGEMLIAVAGRVARAFTMETPGVYRPTWSIEEIARQIDSIRHSAAPVAFPVVPAGQLEHLRYSFQMARRAATPPGG